MGYLQSLVYRGGCNAGALEIERPQFNATTHRNPMYTA